MAQYFTAQYTFLGDYDGEIRVSRGFLEPGQGVRRDGFDTMIHTGTSLEYHPDQPKVMKARVPNIFIKGAFKFSFMWLDGEFTEQEIDDYTNLIGPGLPVGTTITKSMASGSLIIQTPEVNTELPDWIDRRMPWLLKSSQASIEAVTNGELVCFTILNNLYDDYTFQSRTIGAGETVVVDRGDYNVCYNMFTGPVSVNGNTLTAYELYKLSSSSISVQNTGDEMIRVIRLGR